jgi:hypothetical protein
MPRAKPRRARRTAEEPSTVMLSLGASEDLWHWETRTGVPAKTFASSRFRVSQSRCGTGNVSREAAKGAKGAKKGGGTRHRVFRSLGASKDLGRWETRTSVPDKTFASSRLRVSQRKCWAGNASREATKGAKNGWDSSRRREIQVLRMGRGKSVGAPLPANVSHQPGNHGAHVS